jgi:NADH dehydrogenase FAD-containing subunit
MLPAIGNGIDPISKVGTATLMKDHGVRQMTQTALKKVLPDAFLVESPEGPEELKFDYGFVCLGMKSASPVLTDIREAFQDDESLEIVNIGDSVRARRIIEGTDEGRNIVLNSLEKHGYL